MGCIIFIDDMENSSLQVFIEGRARKYPASLQECEAKIMNRVSQPRVRQDLRGGPQLSPSPRSLTVTEIHLLNNMLLNTKGEKNISKYSYNYEVSYPLVTTHTHSVFTVDTRAFPAETDGFISTHTKMKKKIIIK